MQLEQDRSLLLKQAEHKLTELSFNQLKIVVDLLGILSPENGQVKNDQSNLGENFDTPEKIRSSKNFLLSIVGLGETEEDDLSERCEEILASEIDPIRGWTVKKS